MPSLGWSEGWEFSRAQIYEVFELILQVLHWWFWERREKWQYERGPPSLCIIQKIQTPYHFIGPSYIQCKNNKPLRENQENPYSVSQRKSHCLMWGNKIKSFLMLGWGSRSRQRPTEARWTGQTKVVRIIHIWAKDLSKNIKYSDNSIQ